MTQPMAKLITLPEQHLQKQPPTVVTQATTWWETVLAYALVKLQEIGLGGHLPVKVCYYSLCACGPFVSVHEVMALIVSHVKWQQKFSQYLATYCISIFYNILIFIRPHPVFVTHKDSPLRQIGLSMKTPLEDKPNKIVAKILEQISSSLLLLSDSDWTMNPEGHFSIEDLSF